MNDEIGNLELYLNSPGALVIGLGIVLASAMYGALYLFTAQRRKPLLRTILTRGVVGYFLFASVFLASNYFALYYAKEHMPPNVNTSRGMADVMHTTAIYSAVAAVIALVFLWLQFRHFRGERTGKSGIRTDTTAPMPHA